MSEQATAVAESSPATPVMEVECGPLVNMTGEQRAEWRKTGEMPKVETPKVEEPQSSDAPKETNPDESADSAAKPAQEQKGKRRPDIEARFKQYTDEIAQLKRELQEVRAPKTQADPSPAKPSQPQTYQDWRKTFKPSEWIEAYAKEHPDATYEDSSAAMADFLGDVRDQFKTLEQQRQTQTQQISAKVDDAKARYGEKFDEVVMPAVNRIMGDQSVSLPVKQMLNDSEVLPDLLFTLGSDASEFENFLKMAPGKQLRYIALTESLIHDELEAKAKPQSVPAPAKTQTSAPKPPTEVGGRAATPADAAESAAKAGDFRSFKQERTRRDLARVKG